MVRSDDSNDSDSDVENLSHMQQVRDDYLCVSSMSYYKKDVHNKELDLEASILTVSSL